MGNGDYRAGDDRQWSDEGLIDGVVWHDFSPEQHFSVPVATCDLWECVEAESFIPFGISLQSNSLPCAQWAAKACRPLCGDNERRSTKSIASSRSSKMLEFRVPDETFNSSISTICHERNHSTSDPERTGVTNSSLCTLEFQEAMDFLLEKESATNYQLSNAYVEKLTRNSGQKLEINGIRSIRREFVKWILKVVEHLNLSSLTEAHAVSLFDRTLSQRLSLDAQVEDNYELLLAATACVWIAAKLEDSSVPHLSCIQALLTVGFDEVKFRKTEVLVLSSLEWRTLGATASDFLANMIAQLPVLGVPAHLLTFLWCRSEEVMRVLLPEVEFVAYQPSVVSFSVMQCLLDEYVPVQTASLMAAFHLALAIDVESKENCIRALKKLVELTQASVLQCPARGCPEIKKRNDLHSDSSNSDTLYTRRLPIPAF
ncbi:unnamed protein product [Calypogeia fissa]